MASLDASFRRPDRRNEPPRFGKLGAVPQWVESVFWTCKGPVTLEHHGGRTHAGLAARVALRLLALAAALWHNQLIGQPGRHLAPYNHSPPNGINHLDVDPAVEPSRSSCGAFSIQLWSLLDPAVEPLSW